MDSSSKKRTGLGIIGRLTGESLLQISLLQHRSIFTLCSGTDWLPENTLQVINKKAQNADRIISKNLRKQNKTAKMA